MKNNAQQRQHVCYDDDCQEQPGTTVRVGKGLVRFLGVAAPVVAGAAVGVVKAAGELLATTGREKGDEATDLSFSRDLELKLGLKDGFASDGSEWYEGRKMYDYDSDD
ncbi:MAG: hypothetical protein ACXIU5_05645 [Halomonadaceae bacterium]|jgi:hypothetical protein